MTSILLAGATGLVGSHALSQILADDRVSRLVAPTRKPLAPHPKLVNPEMDSGAVPIDADWWAVDGAISALGTTRRAAGSAAAFRAIDHDYILTIAKRVRDYGARRFALTSSIGADAHSWFLYTRTKGEVEAAMRQFDFPSLTILRPSLLSGDRHELRPIEGLMDRLMKMAAPVLPMSARVSPAAIVAHLLVEAAIGGAEGTHIVGSADIARAVKGRC